MLRFSVATLAAVCAFGQPISVGVLSEEGSLIPAGVYYTGWWSAPYERNLAKEWKFTGKGLRGVPVHVKEAAEGDFNIWPTDFQGSRSDTFRIVGVVTSPEVPVTLFIDETDNAAQQTKVAAFLEKRIERRLRSLLAAKNISAPKTWTWQRRRILRTESTIHGRTYYQVQHRGLVRAGEYECEDQDFSFNFEAWFTESAGGARYLMTEEPVLSDCYGSDLAWENPAGIVTVDGSKFLVGYESYYEGGSVILFRLDPKAMHRVLRTPFGGDY